MVLAVSHLTVSGILTLTKGDTHGVSGTPGTFWNISFKDADRGEELPPL
jgi:hypothetical protein